MAGPKPLLTEFGVHNVFESGEILRLRKIQIAHFSHQNVI